MGKSYGATGAEATANTRLVDEIASATPAASTNSGDMAWTRVSQLACEYRPHPDFDDDDPPAYVECRRFTTWKRLVYWVLCVLSAGFLPLACKWKPTWSAHLQTVPCHVAAANILIITRNSKGQAIERVQRHTPPVPVNAAPLMAFEHRHVRYHYDPVNGIFVRVVDLSQDNTVGQLLDCAETPRPRDVAENTFLYGRNSIDVEVKPYLKLLVDEVLSPFYLFQVFAIGLWCIEEYYYYAACIFAVSLVSVILTLVETRRNAEKLHDMAKFTAHVRRIHPARDGTTLTEDVCVTQLLPGDLIEIEEGAEMACDAAIVEGGCLVNESMLTGESVPVTKTCLPNDSVERSHEYGTTSHKAHTLFRGTFVMQRRTRVVRAVVVRTGFSTSKGQLVRSILYPKGTRFRFYEDGLKFLMVLGLFALGGFTYTVVILHQRGVTAGKIILRGLDLITTIVPPALPAAMTIGTMYALSRLKSARIFCISPPRVNVAGKLKLFCFDKTGTLTEEGLHLWGLQDICPGPPAARAEAMAKGAWDGAQLKIANATASSSATSTTATSSSSSSSNSNSNSATAWSGEGVAFGSLNQTGVLGGEPGVLNLLGACASCHSLAVLKSSGDSNGAESLSMQDGPGPEADGSAHRTLQQGSGWSHQGSPTARSANTSGRNSPHAAHPHTVHALPPQSLVGDPLEVQLFTATGWRLSEPGDAEHAYVPEIAAPYTYVHPPDEHDAAFVLRSRNASSSGGGGSRIAVSSCSDRNGEDITNSTNVANGTAAAAAAAGNGHGVGGGKSGAARSSGGRAAVKPWTHKTASGLAVLKHYTFSSRNQRMSVLVGSCVSAVGAGKEAREGPVFCYVKGAPERVARLCRADSVPPDFHRQLRAYTQQGLRVLAVAGRRVRGSWAEAKALTRDVIEKDLVLLGLAIFENRVKPRTAPTIDKLSRADIRTLMITGDNILTAVSVAKSCGMVPEEAAVVQAHAVDASAPGGDGGDLRHWRHVCQHTAASTTLGKRHHDGVGGCAGGGAVDTSAGGRKPVGGETDAVVDSDDDNDSLCAGDTGDAPLLPSQTQQPGGDHVCRAVQEVWGQRQLVFELVDAGAKVTPGMEPDGLQFVRFTNLVGQAPASQWRLRAKEPRAPKLSIAVTGPELAELRRHCFEEYERLIVCGTVFARMAPDQKTQLIEDLIDLGYCVGMCGDGANDCGALKAAHVGVSLSEAEASVAAPFTSTVPDIDCVQTLIREGRCALVTSFSCFKFMALYSFIEFTSVMIVYWIDSNLGDFQYLYVDLFVILSLAVTMGRTGPYSRLSKQRPAGSLVTAVIIVSLLLQIGVHMAFQAGAMMYLQAQPWFVPLKPDADGENIKCFENTVVFLVANFQYVWVSLAFSIGKPFRGGLHTNLLYLAAVVVLLALDTFLVMHPSGWLADVMQLKHLPSRSFRLWLLAIVVGNFIASYGLERLVVISSAFQKMMRMLRRKRRYKNRYKDLAKEVIVSDWAASKVAVHCSDTAS